MFSRKQSLPSPEPVTSHTQRLKDALGLSSAEPRRPQDRMKPTLCLLAYSTCRWWWPLLSLALARCPGAGGGHPRQAPGLLGEPVGLTEWAAVGPPRTVRHTLLCTIREGAQPDTASTPIPERPNTNGPGDNTRPNFRGSQYHQMSIFIHYKVLGCCLKTVSFRVRNGGSRLPDTPK